LSDQSALAPVWRAKYWILGFAVLVGVLAFFASNQRKDQYDAETAVRIISGRQAAGEPLTPDQQQSIGQIYERVAQTDRVIRLAWEAAGHAGQSEEQFQRHVSVQLENEVGVLVFGAHALDAPLAAKMANAYANAFTREVGTRENAQRQTELKELQARVAETEGRLNAPQTSPAVREALIAELQTLQAQVGEATTSRGDAAVVIDAAQTPDDPFSPKPIRDALIALIAMMLLGAAGVYLRSVFVDRFQSAEEISDALGLALLGGVPLERRESPINAFERVEAFRALRTTLLLGLQTVREQAGADGLRAPLHFRGSSSVIVVTSAEAEIGKTHVTAYLARALAATRSVIVVDADLRRPSLHARLGLPSERGLAEYLADLRAPELVAVEVPVETEEEEADESDHSGRLALVAAGRPDERSVERLSTARGREAVESLRNRADMTLIDTPPVGAFSDALVLAEHADGIILVIDLKRTHRRAVVRAVELLRTARVPILGFVLNRVSTGGPGGYGYGYGYGYRYAER
jgi:receptor protein-tyrosine kinase